MGDYLTYKRNRAFDSDGAYPDENYAREASEVGLTFLEGWRRASLSGFRGSLKEARASYKEQSSRKNKTIMVLIDPRRALRFLRISAVAAALAPAAVAAAAAAVPEQTMPGILGFLKFPKT